MERIVESLCPEFRKKLVKACGLITLVGSGYVGYNVYQHFRSRPSSNNNIDSDDSGDLRPRVNDDQARENVKKNKVLELPAPNETMDVVPTSESPPSKQELKDILRAIFFSESFVKIDSEETAKQEYLTAVNGLQTIVRAIYQPSASDADIFNYVMMSTKLLVIEDDSFSLLRAVIFQDLVCGIPLIGQIGGARVLMNKFRVLFEDTEDWLQHWCFYETGEVEIGRFLEFCHECLNVLQRLEEDAKIDESLVPTLILSCKDSTKTDIRLIEAMKLIMMASAIELFDLRSNYNIVPVFASILFFKRETSKPQDLMLNHFNLLGYSRHLEEIDLYLLGYSIKQTLVIVRPELYGTNGFVRRYPECMIGLWPEVIIVLNQNGKYSILGR